MSIQPATDLDPWGDPYANEGVVRDIFEDCGIHALPYEKPFEVWLEDGEVVAVSTVGLRNEEEWAFSVAVLPEYRRQGIAKALIQSILDQNPDREWLPWVVNPLMVQLLDSLGFHADEQEWSPESPYMRGSSPSRRP